MNSSTSLKRRHWTYALNVVVLLRLKSSTEIICKCVSLMDVLMRITDLIKLNLLHWKAYSLASGLLIHWCCIWWFHGLDLNLQVRLSAYNSSHSSLRYLGEHGGSLMQRIMFKQGRNCTTWQGKVISKSTGQSKATTGNHNHEHNHAHNHDRMMPAISLRCTRNKLVKKWIIATLPHMLIQIMFSKILLLGKMANIKLTLLLWIQLWSRIVLTNWCRRGRLTWMLTIWNSMQGWSNRSLRVIRKPS